jgi:voltage-gated potassium channel
MATAAEDLVGVPLFDSLAETELEELAALFDTKNVSESVQLVGEGASGYSFFILVEGGAVVTAEGAEIARLGPGDFFGEMAILGDGRRYASVTTTAPSKVLVLFGTEFRRLQQDHPQIAEKVETAMRERAAQLG